MVSGLNFKLKFLLIEFFSFNVQKIQLNVIFAFFIFIFTQFKKEASSPNPPSQVKYEPFGSGIYPTLVKNKGDQKLLVVLNENTLALVVAEI